MAAVALTGYMSAPFNFNGATCQFISGTTSSTANRATAHAVNVGGVPTCVIPLQWGVLTVDRTAGNENTCTPQFQLASFTATSVYSKCDKASIKFTALVIRIPNMVNDSVISAADYATQIGLDADTADKRRTLTAIP